MAQLYIADIELVPQRVEDVVAYLQRTMPQVAAGLRLFDDSLFNKTHVAPTKTEAGMVRYADGTNWNPGSGAGLYQYTGSAWARLSYTSDLSTYAPLASPTFTGDPKAPTPATADSDTSIATTAMVQAAIDADVATHAAAADPHTGYQKESEKGAASGYGSLLSSARQPFTENAAFRGALVELTANESISSGTSTVVPWDQAIYDTDSIWSSGSPTRLTVPTGVTRVRLSGNAMFVAGSDYQYNLIRCRKNAAVIRGEFNTATADYSVSREPLLNGASAVLTVVAGDYFDMVVFQQNAANAARNLLWDTATWFAMEIVE